MIHSENEEMSVERSAEVALGQLSPPLSRYWAYSFMKRHDDFKSANPTPMETERIRATTHENINNFFDVLEPLIHEHRYEGSLICNFDETMVSFTPKRCRVYAPRTYKTCYVEEKKMTHT
jgi:hypothetical protein